VLNAAWFVLAGMAIVFATLGVLLGVMMALNRALRPRSAARTRAGAASPAGPGVGKTGGAGNA
jgi:Na+-transporting methylmalonyl-CoA/oxaloacetate decarboxylase gamma subunit